MGTDRMTADQHNRLIAHAKALMADAKWMRSANPEDRSWARWWAAMAPREVVAVAVPA